MDKSEIFVFGSNTEGYHGGGAAKTAREQYGAEWGVGEGLTGQSYALPTRYTRGEGKDREFITLPGRQIEIYIERFISFAKDHPELTFRLTAIGCGRAGFTPEQLAPLLRNAPHNVRLPPEFRSALADLEDGRFWAVSEHGAYEA